MSVPYVENIFEVNPSITSWRGYQILCIRSGHRYYWYLGLQKAKVLLNHVDKVKDFISTSGSSAYVHFEKKEEKCPVLVLDNTFSDSNEFWQVGFGMHKCKLFLHWLPYVKKFADTNGQSCNPNL